MVWELVAELCHAALVSGHGVGSGGDGTAHHNVVRANFLGGGGGHNTLLVTHIAIGEADTGGDGQKVLAAAVVDLAGFQGRADNAVQTGFLGALCVVHNHLINGSVDHQIIFPALLVG